MAEQFVLKRGLKNIFAAEVTKDDNEGAGGYVTGTPFHLIPAGEMTRNAENEKTDNYFDNTVFATIGKEGATEVSITGAALRAAALCLIPANTSRSILHLAAKRTVTTAPKNFSGS